MTGVSILGSTGSIGRSTLDVLAQHRDRYEIVALGANRSVDALYEQCLDFEPRIAVMVDADAATQLDAKLRQAGAATTVMSGAAALETIAGLDDVDYVMAAIVGAAGLPSSLAAARAGKRVLLANKESLVMSGKLFIQAVRDHGASLLPIDSEHNAVFQCLPAGETLTSPGAGIRRILLTASGGPFRTTPLQDFNDITPAQAVAHPNWVMGQKISVDSATMMNKGLEVIEACLLFDAVPDQVDVVIHPQSIIHSLVEYADGSMLAQLGNPDMRTPIAHALAWPERMGSGVPSLDLVGSPALEFEVPDLERYPCLGLAYASARAEGNAPAVLNAANEIAVEAFLAGDIRFMDIPAVVEATLERVVARKTGTLDEVLSLDAESRRVAVAAVAQRSGRPGADAAQVNRL